MKITHCKLKKILQRKLLEYFVLEVTARSAADILDIQPNTAILFYRKIRLVIRHHLALEADQVFEGGGFGFEVQLSITEKGRYAVAYGLSCKKDCI
ncbi:IS1016 transposase [Neisseria canis]|uniref:IS1016 transposase n=1 Tax=Neisseria canis TaxID=493 RepID=A0A3S5E8D6_9NEIS|nr:IS1016 transposase [Neisseria canis]